MHTPINIFDFDGTLTTETWPKFWVWIEKFGYSGEKRNDELELAIAKYRKIHSGNDLITFFGFFNDLLTNNNETLTTQELMSGEKFIVYNPGVKNFIQSSKSQNYIVSGGIKEFLENLQIAKYFAGIYGTELSHNFASNITGINDIMTDNKKIIAIQDILRKNNRDITDCRNVFYIGDGYSDASAMRYVHNNGGKAIFVHQPNKNDELSEYSNNIFRALKNEGIVDYCCIADYTKNSKLETILNRNEI